MSLLRLLTTGKSLVGLKSEPHRYRVPRRRVLPKFDARANPFMTVVRPEVPAPQAEQLPAPSVVPEGPSVDSAQVNPAEASCKMPAASATTTRRSLFSLPWVRTRKIETSAAKGSALVQGELSLENVTVVRNDLSDSDLELIPGRKPAGAPVCASEAVPARATQSAPKVESAWGRVTARFFSAAK